MMRTQREPGTLHLTGRVSNYGLLFIVINLITFILVHGFDDVSAASLSKGVCPVNYSRMLNSCYKVNSTSPVTRADAVVACSFDDAHLVDITSAEEQDLVVQLLQNDPILNVKDPGPNVGVWIGLMIPAQWSDGSPLVYTAWADGENGRNEPDVNCVRMDSSFEYQWGDRSCTASYDFVCETNLPKANQDHCPEQYTHYQSSCYKVFSKNPVIRSNAADICSADNAHLVDITSAEEQEFVAQLLIDDPTMNAKTPGSNVGAWIGLMIPETFQWSDGSPLVYTAWADGEENGRNEPQVNCVRMDSSFDYQWGDRNCMELFNFACEKEPEPTTTLHPMTTTADINEQITSDVTTILRTRGELGITNLAIIVCSCLLIFFVLILLIIGCFLRKRKHKPSTTQLSPLSVGPPFTIRSSPGDTSGNLDINKNVAASQDQDLRISVQPDGYVEFKEEPGDTKSPTPEDLRISVQPNGYLEFKPQTEDVTSLSTNNQIIKHTYFDPKQQGLRHKDMKSDLKNLSCTDTKVIKGTPMDPAYYSSISDETKDDIKSGTHAAVGASNNALRTVEQLPYYSAVKPLPSSCVTNVTEDSSRTPYIVNGPRISASAIDNPYYSTVTASDKPRIPWY